MRTLPTSSDSLTSNPYVGPVPFREDDQDRFFGRDRDTEELFSLVTAYNVCILYGQSGTGKSSLLQAGLIPRARGADMDLLPVARLQAADVDGAMSAYDDPYTYCTLASWDLLPSDGADGGATTVSQTLSTLDPPRDAYGDQGVRLAIFDQFEELFTAFPGYWQRRLSFMDDLGRALEADSSLHFVFVVREDYLADALDVVDRLGRGFKAQFRLTRLDRDEAIEAIDGPVRRLTDRRFADGVVEQLVDDLMTIKIRRGPGVAEDAPGQFVEPVQLQVVCTELWRSLPPDVDVITGDHVRTFGDATNALATFYTTCITSTARRTGVPHSYLRRWFQKTLITPNGTRAMAYQGDRDTAGLPNNAVTMLEDDHLLRAEDRAGARWYELPHDRFIGPITRSNTHATRTRFLFMGPSWGYVLLVLAVVTGLLIIPAHKHSNGGTLRTIGMVAFWTLLIGGVAQLGIQRTNARRSPPLSLRVGSAWRTSLSFLARIALLAFATWIFWVGIVRFTFDPSWGDNCGNGSIWGEYAQGGSCATQAQTGMWLAGTEAALCVGLVIAVLWRPLMATRLRIKRQGLGQTSAAGGA
jgi:hypothetical protein